MRNKYPNDPIIEALCEVRFASDSPWDPTVSGRFFEAVKSEFPQLGQARVMSFEVQGAKDTGAIQQRLQPVELVQFWRADKKALLQVGRNLCTANLLKPYSKWEDLRGMIVKGVSTYLDIAHPNEIERVTLRYINRFELPQSAITLNEYFNFSVAANDPLPRNFNFFTAMVQVLHDEDRNVLQIEMTALPVSEPGQSVIQLDLSYASLQGITLSTDIITSWADRAHGTVEDIFESAITDNTRMLLSESHHE